ncbi:MAG: hypothetical protein ABSG89_08635 [Bacteroidales bacterium]|jgi:hypothetical protein
MKKLMVIWALLFLTIIVNAQINNKTNLNELNQDQLNLALKTTSENIIAGKIFTGIGIGLGITGLVLITSSPNEEGDIGPNPKVIDGLYFLGSGILSELMGIPTLVTGLNRKTKIEIELAKFNPKGSVSFNGIGLKIRF